MVRTARELHGEELGRLEAEIAEINGECSELSIDQCFSVWVLRAYLLDIPGHAQSALTGRSREKGTDAILVDRDARVTYLVQTKYRVRRFMKAESRADVMSFAGIWRPLLSPDASAFARFISSVPVKVASQLREARISVLESGHSLRLLYATLGHCSKDLYADARAQARSRDFDIKVECLTGRQILGLLKDYLDGAAPPIPKVAVPLESRPKVRLNGALVREDGVGGLTAWVAPVRGDSIAKFAEHAGRRLYARNIRGFLGDATRVNSDMKRTLETEPERFFYYNNGITIICDGASMVERNGAAVIEIANPQIINGQQTTKVLSENPSEAANASVLVKVIMVPRGASKGAAFDNLVGQVVLATNWQNAIRSSDLRSNDRIQIELEKALRRLDYVYLRKRETKKEARRHLLDRRSPMIKKEDLAQAVAGCELDPVIARSGKDNLFNEEHYPDVFPNSNPLYFLPRLSLTQAVTRGARGKPERGYMKWLVLGFCWNKLRFLDSKPRAGRTFYLGCREDNGEVRRALKLMIDAVYVAAGKYYRSNRGSGSAQIDVSAFFRSKKGRDVEFRSHWRHEPEALRTKFERGLTRLKQALSAG